jgi:hypothetical protein
LRCCAVMAALAHRPAAYLKTAGVEFISAKNGKGVGVRLIRGYETLQGDANPTAHNALGDGLWTTLPASSNACYLHTHGHLIPDGVEVWEFNAENQIGEKLR